jgi:hypothetical protein
MTLYTAVVSDGTGITAKGTNAAGAITDDNGIYKSTDGGATWRRITGGARRRGTDWGRDYSHRSRLYMDSDSESHYSDTLCRGAE